MNISIPYDIYESQYEIIIIIPLWGVKKDSIEIKVIDYVLYITGTRWTDPLRDDFVAIKQDCFRGDISLSINLPIDSAYRDMSSTLSRENILTIIIPKNIVPGSIDIILE